MNEANVDETMIVVRDPTRVPRLRDNDRVLTSRNQIHKMVARSNVQEKQPSQTRRVSRRHT